jgi:hypothetical protein
VGALAGFTKLLDEERWSKADSQSYEIAMHKKKTCELLGNMVIKRKVKYSPSSPQVSRRNQTGLTLIL